VTSAIDKRAVAYEHPDQVRDYYRHNQQARSALEGTVLEDQVVSHILDKARVSEKDASFDDLMNGSL